MRITAVNGHLACVKLLAGFRPDMPTWTTFLTRSGSRRELQAYHALRSRRRPTGSRPKNELPKIFDRAYLEPIWKFQQERYSDLYLKSGDGDTALEIAEHDFTDIQSKVLAEYGKSEYKKMGADIEDVIRAMADKGVDEGLVRDAVLYLREEEHLIDPPHPPHVLYSLAHVPDDPAANEHYKANGRTLQQIEVAKLLRGMMVLPKEGEVAVGSLVIFIISTGEEDQVQGVQLLRQGDTG